MDIKQLCSDFNTIGDSGIFYFSGKTYGGSLPASEREGQGRLFEEARIISGERYGREILTRWGP